jgi:hypothetical protein
MKKNWQVALWIILGICAAVLTGFFFKLGSKEFEGINNYLISITFTILGAASCFVKALFVHTGTDQKDLTEETKEFLEIANAGKF